MAVSCTVSLIFGASQSFVLMLQASSIRYSKRVSSDDTNSIFWMLLLHQNPYKALISVVMILSPFLHQNPQR